MWGTIITGAAAAVLFAFLFTRDIFSGPEQRHGQPLLYIRTPDLVWGDPHDFPGNGQLAVRPGYPPDWPLGTRLQVDPAHFTLPLPATPTGAVIFTVCGVAWSQKDGAYRYLFHVTADGQEAPGMEVGYQAAVLHYAIRCARLTRL
jgi:hypothetical protein